MRVSDVRKTDRPASSAPAAKEDACPRCRYDWRGLETPTCPACGACVRPVRTRRALASVSPVLAYAQLGCVLLLLVVHFDHRLPQMASPGGNEGFLWLLGIAAVVLGAVVVEGVHASMRRDGIKGPMRRAAVSLAISCVVTAYLLAHWLPV